MDAIEDRVPAAPIEPVLDRLEAAYGAPRRHRRLPALDELIVTILSQNTSDVNTDRAFASLRAAFPDWDAVAGAPTAAVVDAIRSGGLANQKAPRIQAVLRELESWPEGFDLERLAELPDEEALARLTALPGVGTKTASCVLLFSLDRPVMPVDTHVLRISRRLGWVRDRASADEAHLLLTREVAPGRMLDAHLLLITHGRRTCRARRPLCAECPVADLCPSAFRVGEPSA